MICPLIRGRDSCMIYCELENCAWYNEKTEECCIKTLTKQLEEEKKDGSNCFNYYPKERD